MWPSLREFLRVPRELTGKNVRIAVIDGEFPHHPDISTDDRRTTYLVPGLSDPDAQPEVFEAVPGPWKGGWHALCAAAPATASALTMFVELSAMLRFGYEWPACTC